MLLDVFGIFESIDICLIVGLAVVLLAVILLDF
jgi:hypothetical protein